MLIETDQDLSHILVLSCSFLVLCFHMQPFSWTGRTVSEDLQVKISLNRSKFKFFFLIIFFIIFFAELFLAKINLKIWYTIQALFYLFHNPKQILEFVWPDLSFLKCLWMLSKPVLFHCYKSWIFSYITENLGQDFHLPWLK